MNAIKLDISKSGIAVPAEMQRKAEEAEQAKRDEFRKAFDEALEVAETPADETVEVDGQIAADGTVEAEVTEIEE